MSVRVGGWESASVLFDFDLASCGLVGVEGSTESQI